ncbi:MAG: sulfite exporter TauE/SafE family protein [Ruminococcus sp.]|jgi:uncharacterized membrane protein YfcA
MEEILYRILICFLAGVGAGLGTGFAGMSAAAVISPMLITFLGVPAYDAIGIALASDVLASAVSARTYAKNKSIDIKNGLVMMIGVLVMTMAGSWVSTFVENSTLGGFSVVMTLLLGLKFLIFPVNSTRHTIAGDKRWIQTVKSLVCGGVIGSICGFFGAGGGMMMLLILTMVLGYELKTAVGTSVFIMTFSALTGAVSHFLLSEPPQMDLLIWCVIFTLIWAQIAAKIAAKASVKTLNRIVGVILTVLGVILVVITYA